MTLRYAAVEGIRALDFGEECVVFNPLSWDAHLLNGAAAAVLELLTGGAQTEEEVAAYLAELLVESERSEALPHGQHLLHELAQLGLVRTVDDVATDR
jgi:PqqD family protein of HPr-rel-A system